MGAVDLEYERRVRSAAMDFVHRLAVANGEVVTREQLQQFVFGSEQIKLLDTGRGIRNPRQLAATLTILTSVKSPYDDTLGSEGYLRYAIRDGELGEGDNRKLRAAFELQLPMIWFQGVRDGVFVPVMPVYLVEELPVTKQYVVAVGDDQLLLAPRLLAHPDSPSEQELAARLYVTRLTKQRLHQPAFRAKVMHAYDTRCAVCSLRHGTLLDAAHIIGDAESDGDPLTSNGLAMCKIHHAAYDQDLLGISPDRVVVINADLLAEHDGPMLRHGLQEFHDQGLRVVPARRVDQPDPDRLRVRFTRFLNAS